MQSRKKLPADAYTIGWVCVNDVEWDAAKVLLDETHSRPSTPNDNSPYIGGEMGGYNIVIGNSIEKGRSAATKIAANMVRSFQKIRFVLMVGIAGGSTTALPPRGVNAKPKDIFLGDVVVSSAGDTHGGILQYDKGKLILGEHFTHSHLNRPPAVLAEVIRGLQMNFSEASENMQVSIRNGLERFQLEDHTETYIFPGFNNDRLFDSAYVHVDLNTVEGENPCANCEEGHVIQRRRRHDGIPRIHYGLVASADTLVRDAQFRDHMRSTHDVLCFEMETAGLMNGFPCVAIRGIADYADTHKNDTWQPYAALTAAAYAKEVLKALQVESVFAAEDAVKCMSDPASGVDQSGRLLSASQPADAQNARDSLAHHGVQC